MTKLLVQHSYRCDSHQPETVLFIRISSEDRFDVQRFRFPRNRSALDKSTATGTRELAIARNRAKIAEDRVISMRAARRATAGGRVCADPPPGARGLM
ncbi:hypothetical protein [Sorangium sp. So ce1078]|uniref:hypothetical protein n=1 Tax=Sorangium sp. So ce1078 TaxID=3133329 RepID=UPI003F62F64B